MERRREPRATADRTVVVTVLGRKSFQISGTAVELSGRGMRLLLSARVSPGDPVKIDMGDGLLLGEICYCQTEGIAFLVGVELDQALAGLSELARQNLALFDEPSSHRPTVASRDQEAAVAPVLQNRDREILLLT